MASPYQRYSYVMLIRAYFLQFDNDEVKYSSDHKWFNHNEPIRR